jgi:5-methyltetrahydropteroyltriglutamate--homocysteine methyltransferase
MKLSTDRILTTHVGSLPRSQAVVDKLFARMNGEPYDQAEFDAVMQRGVSEAVAKQASVGVDVVSDGETSKVSYSTYVTDRLTGFEGDSPRRLNVDVAPYPEFREKLARMTGAQPMPRAVCVGPIAIKDRDLLKKDLAHMKEAVEGSGVTEGFLNAASPGVVSVFQPNQYYPTHEAYIEALADVMKEEYEAIVEAGFILQLDCPDLAMARHTAFQDLSEPEFLKRAELQMEALNYALENVPAESARMHVCWGNYEGPHTYDIPVERLMGILLKAKPAGLLFEAANARHSHEWKAWRDAKIPDNKVLIPGVLDSTSNFVEHPELVAQRIETFANIVGRERVIAGTDCGFGTFAGFGKMDPDITYVKFQAMVEGAVIASKRLWSAA